jgi:hypothetical protein
VRSTIAVLSFTDLLLLPSLLLLEVSLLFRYPILNLGSGHAYLDAAGFLNEHSRGNDYRNRPDAKKVAEISADDLLITGHACLRNFTELLPVRAVNR